MVVAITALVLGPSAAAYLAVHVQQPCFHRARNGGTRYRPPRGGSPLASKAGLERPLTAGLNGE